MTMKASPVTEPGTQSPMVLAGGSGGTYAGCEIYKREDPLCCPSGLLRLIGRNCGCTNIARLPPYVVTAVLAAAEASIDASLSRSCIFASGPRPSSYPSSTLSRIEEVNLR